MTAEAAKDGSKMREDVNNFGTAEPSRQEGEVVGDLPQTELDESEYIAEITRDKETRQWKLQRKQIDRASQPQKPVHSPAEMASEKPEHQWMDEKRKGDHEKTELPRKKPGETPLEDQKCVQKNGGDIQRQQLPETPKQAPTQEMNLPLCSQPPKNLEGDDPQQNVPDFSATTDPHQAEAHRPGGAPGR